MGNGSFYHYNLGIHIQANSTQKSNASLFLIGGELYSLRYSGIVYPAPAPAPAPSPTMVLFSEWNFLLFHNI